MSRAHRPEERDIIWDDLAQDAAPTSEPAAGQPDGVQLAGRRVLAGLLISAVALAACGWWALSQPAPEFPSSAGSIALLVAAVGVLAFSMLVRGFRWSVILNRAGIEVSRAEPYALVLVGYMGNTVLPVRGGELLRVLLLKDRSGVGWAEAIGGVIPERVLDVVTLALLFTGLVLAGVVEVPGGLAPAVVAIVGVLALGGGLAGYFAARRRGHLEALALRIAPLVRASRPLLSSMGAWLALISCSIWLLDGALFLLVAESLSISISPLDALGVAVVAAAFAAIPAGPAFAGTYDAAVIFSLEGLGIVGGVAVTYLLLLRFVVFVPPMVAGLAVLITRYGGFDRLRALRCPPPAPAN